jgi:tetratricopeptide (TPR) repeat protein
MGKAEEFFRLCTTLPLEEVRDERNEASVPELARVAELRDAGNMQEAVDYAMALVKMYPDYDLIPFMIAYIYYQKEFPAEARKVAVDAMSQCNRKYRLYSVAGLAEFDLGRLPEALVWWSRSVIAQCMVEDFQEYDPFLHLAHAAEILGAKRQATLLFQMTDAIEPDSHPRADDPSINKLMPLKKSWAGKVLVDVLKYIDANYLQG